MNWQNLLTGEEDEIAAGSVFRVKAEWPYEEIVDFMLLYLPSESSTHALIVCTGMKAGRVLKSYLRRLTAVVVLSRKIG